MEQENFSRILPSIRFNLKTKEEKIMDNSIEYRAVPIEMRADITNRKIIGHAALFNSISLAGGWFAEQIAPGAFADSIQRDDIRALFNHNPDHVLGRNIAGTLKLEEDSKGLAIEIKPPDTQFARDLMVSINRGDISQMSFGFQITKSDDLAWDEEQVPPLRTVLRAKLWDISPVTFPFYTNTDVALKSLQEYRSAHIGQIQQPNKESIIRIFRAI
jgi:uncharacterized protein